MNLNFDEKLIEGKITELIFEEMFHKQKEFEALHNGYEYTNPEIAQNLQNLNKEQFERMRHKPDFILLSWNKKQQFLVEVKYRSYLNQSEIVDRARELINNYNPCHLFIATPEKFYFNSCKEILEKGTISEMSESWIPKSMQKSYLESLNKFIPKGI